MFIMHYDQLFIWRRPRWETWTIPYVCPEIVNETDSSFGVGSKAEWELLRRHDAREIKKGLSLISWYVSEGNLHVVIFPFIKIRQS